MLKTLWDECRGWRRLYLFRRPLVMFLVVYCAALVGLKRAGVLDRVSSEDPSWWADHAVAITGVVASHPDSRPIGCVFVLRAETIEVFGEEGRQIHSVAGFFLLHVSQATEKWAEPGDRLRAVGRLQRPRASSVPGTFDYADYLRNHDVHCLLYTSRAKVENLGPSGSRWLMRAGWRLKQKTIAVFKSHLSEPRAAVLAGLVVGSRPRFNPEIKRIFIESGTMHILVASGSNVAFVIALWFIMVRLLFRLRPAYALGTSLPAIWMYVLLVGLEAPIMRAGLMATVSILSYLFAREDRAYHALTLAALAILLPEPKALFDVGFQMSFATVFGMLYFLPPLDPLFANRPLLIRWLLRLVAATLTAQLWLAPLTAAVFKRFFPIGLLTNVVMIPLAAFGLAGGLALAAADFLAGHMPHLRWAVAGLSSVISGYAQTLIHIARFFADHPGKSWWFGSPSWGAVCGFYLACFSVVGVRRAWTARIGFVLGIGLVLLGVKAWNRTSAATAGLRATWIDTGRRLSVLIQTPEGRTVLVNPGPIDPVDTTERVLMPFLSEESVRRLDAVVITPTDPALTAGLATLKKSMEVRREIRAGTNRGKYFWGGLTLEVLNSGGWSTEPALLFTYGGRRLLLTQVLSLATQDEILDRGIRHLDIFQARFSEKLRWRDEFIAMVRPDVLVETGLDTEMRPSVPPWEDRTPVVPQKRGWWRWSAPAPAKKKDEQKARRKTAGVRPPGHASGVASRRQG